jgi:hypothetical protein
MDCTPTTCGRLREWRIFTRCEGYRLCPEIQPIRHQIAVAKKH